MLYAYYQSDKSDQAYFVHITVDDKDRVKVHYYRSWIQDETKQSNQALQD